MVYTQRGKYCKRQHLYVTCASVELVLVMYYAVVNVPTEGEQGSVARYVYRLEGCGSSTSATRLNTIRLITAMSSCSCCMQVRKRFPGKVVRYDQ